MANIELIPNALGGLNYSIAPSVTSNNLTVAIKDATGNDPTSLSPCVFRIGNTARMLSTSLSITKNAGTNWANLGGASLATLEQDLFVYIVWNTNTSALDIMWSRLPYATLYSDFNATSTANTHGAINATAPASTDSVVNIGRFAATLSAGAGYTWTVPTYTANNLRSYPTYQTRSLTYVPTWIASGTAVSLGDATLTGTYRIDMRTVTVRFLFAAGSTTTFGTGTYSWALPFTAALTSYGAAWLLDSGSLVYNATTQATSIIIAYPDAASNIVSQTIPMTWANGDTIQGQVTYEI